MVALATASGAVVGMEEPVDVGGIIALDRCASDIAVNVTEQKQRSVGCDDAHAVVDWTPALRLPAGMPRNSIEEDHLLDLWHVPVRAATPAVTCLACVAVRKREACALVRRAPPPPADAWLWRDPFGRSLLSGDRRSQRAASSSGGQPPCLLQSRRLVDEVVVHAASPFHRRWKERTGPDRPVRQTANTRASGLLTCGELRPDFGIVDVLTL
ncbi:MAG TPA: hypothetical protein VI316_05465 [Candidatus Dormibacteraeota bacterium]